MMLDSVRLSPFLAAAATHTLASPARASSLHPYRSCHPTRNLHEDLGSSVSLSSSYSRCFILVSNNSVMMHPGFVLHW